MADVGGLLVIGIILLVSLPFLLLALFGILWMVVYPVMLIWAFLFSGKQLNRQIAAVSYTHLTLPTKRIV